MNLSELPEDEQLYTALGRQVLAVLSRRVDGWAVYVGAVPGERHRDEWPEVARHGDKLREPLARAVVENYFHPGFEIDLPYVP